MSEIEINPLTFVDGRPVVLDALARLGVGAARAPSPDMPAWRRRAVRALLEPRSVVVVGVSARGANPGRTILANLLSMGFAAENVRSSSLVGSCSTAARAFRTSTRWILPSTSWS